MVGEGVVQQEAGVALIRSLTVDRYSRDVLAPGWQKAHLKKTRDVPVELDLVVEFDDFCGAVVGWENGIVLLEDRKGKRRGAPLGPGFLLEGEPVALRPPLRGTAAKPRYTASGSRTSEEPAKAKVALPSRIYVEGRHDAELIEKVWGDDLRHTGVVVEFLGGIDDLPAIVAEFAPEPGRRLGVLVDHLVPGSKESRIAKQVYQAGYRDTVLIEGHEFIDIWQAVRPERIGRKAWPQVPPRRRLQARHPQGAQPAPPRPGRHRARLAGDPGKGVHLARPGTPTQHQGRDAHRLRHAGPSRRLSRRDRSH